MVDSDLDEMPHMASQAARFDRKVRAGMSRLLGRFGVGQYGVVIAAPWQRGLLARRTYWLFDRATFNKSDLTIACGACGGRG